jgi:hypothetical protein
VRHIRGLSFGWRRQELYAADDQGRLFLGAGPTFDLSLHSDTTPALVNHMIRSGNIDGVVYMAVGDGTGDNNGFMKWIPDTAAPFYVRKFSGRQGYMIGYGPAHVLPSSARLVLLPYGAAGAADKLFMYDVSLGNWSSITPPVSGYYWRWLSVSPLDTNQWLLLGNSGTSGSADYYSASSGSMKTQNGSHSPLWLSTDAGATWSEVDLPTPNGNGSADQTRAITRAEWSPIAAATWYASRLDITQGKTTTIWTGSGTSGGTPFTDTTATAAQHIIPLTDGAVYVTPAATSGNPHKASYVASGALTTPSGSSIGGFDGSNVPLGDRLPGTRSMLMTTVGGDLYGAVDYSTAQPTLITGVGGLSSCVVGTVVLVGSRAGVNQVADPFGAATTTIVFASGQDVGVIRSDRQSHTQAAVLTKDVMGVFNGVGLYNGTVWTTLSLPTDADPSALYDFIEVVVA